jgi:hypothetical protein
LQNILTKILIKNKFIMRKILILALSAIVCIQLHSQTKGTMLKEFFDSPDFPSGWTISSNNANWSVSNSNLAGGDPYELHMSWSPQFNGKTRVISPVINTTGATELVLEFIHYCDLIYGGAHVIGIETTSNGGATWTEAWRRSYSSAGNALKIKADITTSDVGSSGFQFCLFYQGNSYNIDNWYFDNFDLYSRENLDAAITGINQAIRVNAGDNAPGFSVTNRGYVPITELEVEYQYGDMPPVTATFTSFTLQPLASRDLVFNSKTFLLPDNTYNLSVKILKVNGEQDDNEINNLYEKNGINVGSLLGNRRVCIEHFTSSSCGPCVNPNAQMKTLLQNNPDKFGISKYQMNWPGNGDPYYTAEGGVRRTYYGVNAVPTIFFNGKSGSVNQNTFNAAFNEPAFMDIAGTYSVSGTTVTVNFDITSYIKAENVKIYAIVNEKLTTGNRTTNGEREFIHVMMKMLPDGNGTTASFNTGEVKSFAFTQDMSGTHVEEMDDLEVHVFVQDHASKYIYNSNFLANSETVLYPPTNLIFQNKGYGFITASWEGPQTRNNTGYKIYLNNQLVEENYTSESITLPISIPVGYQAFKVCAIYESVYESAYCSDYIITCTCEKPTLLNAEPDGQDDKDVSLSWTAPAVPVDSYVVYCNGNIVQVDITETTFTHTNAPFGDNVYGVSAVINGCVSEIEETEITVPCALLPPTGLQAEVTPTTVILSWEAVDYDDVTYNIYLDGTLLENITGTTCILQKEDVPEGMHTISMKAVFGTCESVTVMLSFQINYPPNIITASLPNGTIDEPYDQTLSFESSSAITWSIEGNLPDGLNFAEGTISGIPTTEETAAFTVSATNTGGTTGKNFSITIEPEVSIITVENDLFKIYPNPTTGELKIENGELKIENVKIYNAAGILQMIIESKNLKISKSKSLTIDVSHLPAGIYFMQINEHTVKVVKK